MRPRIVATALGFALLAGCTLSHGPNADVALEGDVQSAAEGTMEGVVVSAKREGSTITTSVISDAKGHYAFAADRLQPGRYNLSIRATGFDLVSPATAKVTAGAATTADLRLDGTKDLAAQMSNADWLNSAPGTVEQKRMLLSCNECHRLDRPLMSTHSADEFVQVMQRMAGYAYNSMPEQPQLLSKPYVAKPENYREAAQYLASINLSAGGKRSYPLRPLPRVTGAGTKVVITEYDLPRPLSQPHDVITDPQGNVWYCDFGKQVIGRLDPKTGAVREFPVPVLRSGEPTGQLDIEWGSDGMLWVGMHYQGAVGRFDPKTETFKVFPIPPQLFPQNSHSSMVVPAHLGVDGKVWTISNAGILRLDIRTGQYEAINAFNHVPPTFQAFSVATGSPRPLPSKGGAQPLSWQDYYNRRIAGKPVPDAVPPFGNVPAIYGMQSDSRNNLYTLDFGGGRINRIDAKDGHISEYKTSEPVSRGRRGQMDGRDRLWFAQYNVDRIGMLDTRSGALREWRVPTRWTGPYDVAIDGKDRAWTAGMNTDRIVRIDTRTGKAVEYQLPRFTNVRRVFVDDKGARPVFWVGNNHGGSIIKVEPLD